MVDVKDVIAKLLERTNQDRIRWKSTVTANTFVAVVGNLSLSISYPRSVNSRVRLRILDQLAQPIDEFSTSPNGDPSMNQALEELHEKAKRAALGTDNHLEDLMRELEKV